MWKLRVALFVAFIGISDALNSDSLLLKSKLRMAINNASIFDGGNSQLEALPTTGFDYVVSIGIKSTRMLEAFIHKGSGIMLTQQYGLSPVNSGIQWATLERRSFMKLYAQFPRSSTLGDNTYHLEFYGGLQGPILRSTNPNFILRFKLDYEIPPSLQSFSAPIYSNSKPISVDEIIAWNNIESNIPPGRKYLQIRVRLIPPSRCGAEPKLGQFCITPVYERHALTESDLGGLVLNENKIVGLISNHNGRAEAIFGMSAIVCYGGIMYPPSSTSGDRIE